jgi:AI-2 transport protein TqsA
VLNLAAAGLVSAAAAWYLLRELAGLLRPLLLAVFLAYVILPVHAHISRRVPRAVAVAVFAAGVLGLLYLLALLTYDSVNAFRAELPALTRRAEDVLGQVRASVAHVPWLDRLVAGGGAVALDAPRVHAVAATVAGQLGEVLSEGLVVLVYLVFLSLEAARLPRRVREGFASERAAEILAIAGSINAAIARYLKAKVLASLLLAVPAGLILWAFGVKFALLWAVLTFFANFIPYLGSVVACALPITLAFLQLPFGWPPAAAALLLVATHTASAYLIEPPLVGRSVDLSPLVILVALAFWGLCWGLPGMLLAVPLTVALKIVFEHVPITRPLARLMAER